MTTLSHAGQVALRELTEYHAQRLADFESRNRQRNSPRLNFARMFDDLSRGNVHGEDREALQELAHKSGIQHIDPQRPFIPFTALRDLNKATPSAGGYLVSAETQEAVDILRPWSVTARAGLTIETGLVGDQAIPKTTGKSTPYWLNTELAGLTPSTPTVAQASLTPKTAGASLNFSRQLSKQANAENFVRRELLRTVGTAVDQAVINGTGASGQPLGLLNTTGIGTQSGTSLAYTGVTTMKKTVSEANAPDESISYVSTPAVRQLLENRERITGGGSFIWDNDQVASRPAYVSTDIPTATMICGAWEAIYFGVWGSGFVVEINPYEASAFKVGTIQARVLVSCDVAVLHPAAFNVATSIT